MRSLYSQWIESDNRTILIENSSHELDYSPIKVYTLLFFGVITLGLSPILVRFATDIQPMTLAAMRTAFAVVILFPFWLSRRKKMSEWNGEDSTLKWIVLAGICLGTHFSFWIASLHYTSVASATVLVTVNPVMLIVIESAFFRKRFRPLVWVGVFVACAGSVLLGISDRAQASSFADPTLGNILALIAAVIFVLYFLIGQKVRQKTEWIDYVFNVYFYAAITCTVLTLIWAGGLPYISAGSLIIGLALAIGPTITGHGAMNYAVKYISPTIIATLVLSETVLAAVVAYFVFDELPSQMSIIAMCIILTGVGMSWSREKMTKEN